MCTKLNLELFSAVLSLIRYMASLYFFITGCVIAGNIHLSQAFGRGMTAIGALLIIFCFFNSAATSIMHFGMKRHNKCIILAALVLDLFLAGVQLILGSVMYSRTLPDSSEAMKLDCLLKVPEKHTQGECLEYLQSDRYAGMMLVWRSYSHLSVDYAEYYQRLATIEQDGACCGFGPPMRCTEDTRGFPSWTNINNVGFRSDKRYVCGQEVRSYSLGCPLCGLQDNWYEKSYFCSQNVDETAVFLEKGGCKYDYPMGDCMDNDVDASTSKRGCASVMETHITNKIIYHSMAIMGLSSILAASVFSGCCMFWKREYADAIPDYVIRHIPWDPYKDKGSIHEPKVSSALEAIRQDGTVRLDRLGELIVGEMPVIDQGKIATI